jgi:hypothetical protein
VSWSKAITPMQAARFTGAQVMADLNRLVEALAR